MAGGIFISYRRSDSAAFAGRIADFFAYNYDDVRVFFDIVGIDPGADFVETIRTRIQSSEIVLAIIGETWLSAADADGARRLDNPQDFVRLELAMALELGARVIPVLLDNAQMPGANELPKELAGLARCNAELVRGAAFQRDAQHLGEFVYSYLIDSTKTVTAAPLAEARAVDGAVKSSLVAAFETYCGDAHAEDFMIVSDTSDRFVQFTRGGTPDGVLLDLPSAALTEDQLVSARRLLMEDYSGETWEYGDGEFTFNLDLPLDPAYLSHITLDVFEHIYRELPSVP
ncbi:MAG: toll/interleukin-1 receptor domain-containing protein, partial [Pseudomonadota bacterium]